MKINDLLVSFIHNPNNSENNFLLALYYHNIGQTASALSYYLRTAERTDDKLFQYECLIKASMCFDEQGCRNYTVKGLLQSAVALCPKRPEGYFLLSRFYEKEQNWHDSYLIASIGIVVSDFNCNSLRTEINYPGKYGILFEKAVSSWHCGLCDDSRDLFIDLKKNYDLDEIHDQAVENNLIRLNIKKPQSKLTQYDISDQNKLKFQFENLEIIDKNYSEAYQDMFVLSMLNGKKNGTYLEIGAGDPFYGNNTALLETKFGWKGIALDIDENFVTAHTQQRNHTCLLNNALEVDYKKLLNAVNMPTNIDYLQLDCDPPEVTYKILLTIPFKTHKFAVITYEHDYYCDETKSFRDKSRKYLQSFGYQLVVDNISPDDEKPFEDWWVHPDLIDNTIINKMLNIDGTTKKAKNYILSGNESNYTLFDCMSNSKSTSWIVDNFYDNPDEIRKFALEQEFIEGGFGRGFIGRRTEKQFLFPNLKEKFEEIMGKKIAAWQEHGMNGRFQICWSGEPLVYHCDSQQWGGMLYLTPNAPYQCGTTLYANKQTRARTYYDDGWDDAWKDVPGDSHLDGTPFEPVDVLGNVYNRLVIFDASAIHSASEYFGTVKENARLWQMFFFDTIDTTVSNNKFYSEFETDKYLRENFFPDLNHKGVMVEVGAGPPEFINNSKHFRDSGWRTISVEPNPKFVKQHKDTNSEVYQYACCNEEKETTFIINYNNDDWYSQENDGVSFSSLGIRYDNVPEHNTQEVIKVQTIKLNTLLDKIYVSSIDILSIDTEGWELEVMMGFDQEKYLPKVIVLENYQNNLNYEPFMKDRNYIKHSKLGYNEIYVREKLSLECVVLV